MAETRPSILLIDDEPHSLQSMRMALEDEFDCFSAENVADGTKIMAQEWIQVVICDQRMPTQSGVSFLSELREHWPEVIRILITGYTDPEAMAQAINKAGIHQFISKPWHPDQLLIATRNATKLFQLSRENERLSLEMRFLTTTTQNKVEMRRKALRESMGFESILRGPQSPMNQVIDTARLYATFDVPVLLIGEMGTESSKLAHAMHFASLRSDKPFLSLDLTGIPEELIAIELFGAKRGVLAGGVARIGMAQKADRGTLYLGGVETLSPALQLSLYRLANEGSFTPVGGHEVQTTNLRIIARSSTDLAEQVAEGKFYSDLYYALSVAYISLPPLRARRSDIAFIAQHMLADISAYHKKASHGFDPIALTFLENYDWPGNLFELKNEITRMLMRAENPILSADLISRPILQAEPGDCGADRVAGDILTQSGSLKDRVELIEMRILRETLTRLRWNKSRAAAELGLSRVGLRAKLDRYDIIAPSDKSDVDEEREE